MKHFVLINQMPVIYEDICADSRLNAHMWDIYSLRGEIWMWTLKINCSLTIQQETGHCFPFYLMSHNILLIIYDMFTTYLLI